MSYAWFNALDALLFLILGFAGLTRIRTGFVASQGQIQRSVPFIVLSLYCFTRSAVLTVTALDKIPRNQDFEQNMFDAAPATFYALLQTALIWKWVDTVADDACPGVHEVQRRRRRAYLEPHSWHHSAVPEHLRVSRRPFRC